MMVQNDKIIIYSQNLGAFLRFHGKELYYGKDGQGKAFIYTNDTETTRKLIKEYKENRKLHEFLQAYKEIRANILSLAYGLENN